MEEINATTPLNIPLNISINHTLQIVNQLTNYKTYLDPDTFNINNTKASPMQAQA